MSKKLSKEEISRRLVRWRNLERLYKQARTVISDLRTRLRAKTAESSSLRAELAAVKAQNADQAIRIAELETAVFGKRKCGGGSAPSTNTTKKLFS